MKKIHIKYGIIVLENAKAQVNLRFSTRVLSNRLSYQNYFSINFYRR